MNNKTRLKMNNETIKSKIIRYIKPGFIIFNVLLILVSISSAATSQTPYSGTALKVPGTIQAENFDKGGEGIAYHDTEKANQGNQYRPADGVDTEKTSDIGGGYNIGWTLPGEWLEYTINVANTGNYKLETRVANVGTGGTFHIEFNGVDKTGPITVPDTGSYQTWKTLTKTVSLSAGQQVMKIVMDKKGDYNVANINYIRITASQSSYSVTPLAIPGTIQAENFDKSGEGIAYHDTEKANQGNQYRPADGVDIEITSDIGGGYNIGWTLPGEWLTYTVKVANTGNYKLETRVANVGTGGTFHIEFNGVDKTGPITVPDTGSYQTWKTLTKTVSLSAGQQVMKIVMDKKGGYNVGNINYIRITPATTSAPIQTPTPTSTPATTRTPAPSLTPSPIVSGAFYVATNGNDANPGTEARPWRTIQKAADTLTAGQTVYVKAGTYKEQITVRNSGSAGKYITFSAYPGNTVTVDGTGINMNPGYGRDGGLIQIWGKSYIKVTGFTVINSGYAGLFVNTPGSYNNPPSHDIIFEGNTVKDSWAAAIMMFGRGSSNAENYVARNNIIIRGHMGGDPMAHESLSVGGKISNFEISGNTIKDSFWGAIDSKDGVYNGKIFGNTCTNTEMSCIYVDGYSIGADNIDVFNNVVHDMKNVGTESNGFNVNSEQGGPTTNIRFYNNLVYNNPGTAMRMASYRSGTEGKVDHITITSNTFYNNGVGNSNRGGIILERNDATNTVVRNNIIYNNGFGIKNSDADAIISNNLETNPSFVNPSANNFHLQVNSPAIDKGSAANAPKVDFDRKLRPSGTGYDIGAYEH
ncbi:endoglucanase [Methanosarcinales archaeon]|nr:endoglucanase [Methanosarcinales archaeon]